MFTSLAKIILKSQVSKENFNRKKQFLSWNDIKTIALILNSNDKINKSAMDKFTDNTGKLVTIFYVETSSKTPTYGDWLCFTKKNRNVFGFPSEKNLTGIKKTPYDLAINTSDETDLFSSSLISSLQATLKAGNGKSSNVYDLIIKKGDPHHVIDYLNEVIKYLKMIRT